MAKKKKGGLNPEAMWDEVSRSILHNLPFLLFLSLLAVIYIANSHYAFDRIRKIQRLEHEIRDLRWNYYGAQSDLMYRGVQSKVAKRVDGYGLEPLKSPAFKIIVENEED